MLSYERSFSIFKKSSKIITRHYQKKFLKDSVFHSSTMRDYQIKIGFLIFILGIYAKILRISRKLIKIEIFFWFFKNKKRILQFYNLFFYKKNRLFCFTTNHIFYKDKKFKKIKKNAFLKLKSGLPCNWCPNFYHHYHNLHVWTTKTIFNDFQKMTISFFCVVIFWFSIFNIFGKLPRKTDFLLPCDFLFL